MKTRPEPFAVRDGRLFLEDSDLTELSASLEGRSAWLMGHHAVSSAIAAAGRCTVPVSTIGPPAVLAMLARADAWARACSSHELDLARAAGFTRERIVAGGRVLEDGFLRDVLSEGVAVLECDEHTAANAARIGAALGLGVPPSTGAPPNLPADALARCGGLLAPLLHDPPGLVLDAVWEPDGADAVEVWPIAGLGTGEAEPRQATLLGLQGSAAHPARLHGAAARGEWVLVPSAETLALRSAHAAHAPPRTVAVRAGSWRVLEPRRFPAAD